METGRRKKVATTYAADRYVLAASGDRAAVLNAILEGYKRLGGEYTTPAGRLALLRRSTGTAEISIVCRATLRVSM